MVVDDAATAFLGISPYVSEPADLQAALASDVRADVAIVGGGFTGLSTALALHERGIDAVILERHFCGYGASGRNAGHLTPTICKDLPTAVTVFGREVAAQLARYADFCVENTEGMIQRHAIDCDYHRSGNLMAVIHPSQERRLRKATAAAVALGAKMHFVEAAEMRERRLPPAFLCGSMEEAGGSLHPGKLVLGLRRAALARGIRIFEQTQVQRIEGIGSTRVVTPGGSVRAKNVVIASNAYTPEIGKPGERISPLYITLFETAPLSDAQVAALGWTGREGIYTAHESMESYRLTAQRTIIGGSKDVQYFYDCAPHNHGGENDARKASVIKAFRERFPMLGDVPIAHAWAGWCGFTLNFMPAVGQARDNPDCYHAVGYNGHGIAQATSMGELMADLIQKKPNPWHGIVCRLPPHLPSRTLQFAAANMLLTLFNGLDRRVDRKVRAGTQ